jgi:hypothetical protein
MKTRARTLLATLIATITIGAITITACDDAILGERLLGCDGSACSESSTTDGTTSTPDTCPSAPSAPVCDAGVLTSQIDGNGCTVAFTCEIACASTGGTCSTKAACMDGRWSTAAVSDCADSGEVQGCCRLCPAISAPPPGFCDAGTNAVGVYDGNCLIGFACQ